MKVLCIFGTRPETIKLAPVVHALRADQDFEVVVCVTAQHRELLDDVMQLFGIVTDIDLDLMEPDQDLAAFFSRALSELDRVMQRIAPDAVLVQGDTTTAMAGALAAFYRRIPVGHVEAGLRTYDNYQPFPEEINRRAIGMLASLNFAPTTRAAEALKREGCPPDSIIVTGNTVIDALDWVRSRVSRQQQAKYQRKGMKLVLVTAHRRENFGNPLHSICAGILELAERNEDVWVLFPVHPNPNVIRVVSPLLGNHPRIELADPLPYDEFVAAMGECQLILTDSGGIQEEAPSLNKPVLVLREKTERPEAIEAGTAVLVGSDTAAIVTQSEQFLFSHNDPPSARAGRQPFGDGRASHRIRSALRSLAGLV
jgi:UDP-N-acetylglucosamine 2-epimerase (non-hydrolysing)